MIPRQFLNYVMLQAVPLSGSFNAKTSSDRFFLFRERKHNICHATNDIPVYFVVQLYPCFEFSFRLFLGVVMSDSQFRIY